MPDEQSLAERYEQFLHWILTCDLEQASQFYGISIVQWLESHATPHDLAATEADFRPGGCLPPGSVIEVPPFVLRLSPVQQFTLSQQPTLRWETIWAEQISVAPLLDPRIEGDNTARVEAALQQPGQHELTDMSLEQIESLLARVLEPEEGQHGPPR